MELLKVGIIGAGRMGELHARNVTETPGCVVSVVWDLDATRSERIAQSLQSRVGPNPESVFQEADAVIVTTPTSTHLEYIEMALQYGVPAMVEKPLTFSAGDLEKLRAMNNLHLIMPAYMRRFDRAYRTAQQYISEGKIGRVLSVIAIGRDQTPPTPEFVPQSGGLFFDMGVHDYDLIQWLTGQRVVRVRSISGGLWRNAYMQELGDPEEGAVLLNLDEGAIAQVLLSRSVRYGYDIRMRVFGTEGSLEIGEAPRDKTTRFTAEGMVRQMHSFPDRFEDAYRSEIAVFLDCVRKGAAFPVDVASVLEAERVAYAAAESQRRNHAVNITERREGVC
ncbi:Gfo/Idh/MocA family protein [Alicyclobacillus shizuokensis]|uniref:Gfo/Idh/MocA family protein n=1 Tax=Alicyclobacillus shizuokensis TaxID=392014 RepID=UPI0008315B2B|nr:Gfo/Idh/MocA family oxidoreductase [Alicyclobacillus shizuokensis]